MTYFDVDSLRRPRHVYVHVPFCARRCSYCDFSIAVRRTVPVDEYVRAVDRELALRYDRDNADPWTIDTLYFGEPRLKFLHTNRHPSWLVSTPKGPIVVTPHPRVWKNTFTHPSPLVRATSQPWKSDFPVVF